MEVRTVRWSWLGELDRKYGKNLPRSSASPQTPSDSSPADRVLRPSGLTLRQVLQPGRVLRLLLGHPPRLSGPWIIVAHRELTCQFRRRDVPEETMRSLPWRVWERHVLEDHVRWLNSIGRPCEMAYIRYLRERRARLHRLKGGSLGSTAVR